MSDYKHTIEEGNKMIAEFMELSTSVLHGDLCYADWDGMHLVKYHESWDWLMPVVEKIETTSNVYIARGYCGIQSDQTLSGKTVARAESRSKIESVWNACVQFIQWYNSTQSK